MISSSFLLNTIPCFGENINAIMKNTADVNTIVAPEAKLYE
jgi:hypothetical protein